MKILFFSDSHLGFDFPIQPRIQRRRRGYDFFSNYAHILDTALTQNIDLIVHGGDLFFRSRVHPLIIEKAFQPLVEVANVGIPIYLVPGNHERSKFPGHLWLAHENIHVFDKPKTFFGCFNGLTIALSGFPFTRKVESIFQTLLHQTNYLDVEADAHLLCIHQTVEGAQVGPGDFTFRSGLDNIPGSEIPETFTAVLSGHIHRAQQLTHTLDRRTLHTPVIYPGSIERTSLAERFEEKYYVTLKIGSNLREPEVEYHQLPSRPMVKVEILSRDKDSDGVRDVIQGKLAGLDPDSIVRIQITGPNAEEVKRSLSASVLRSLAPPTMNLSLDYQWRNGNNNPKR